MSAVIIDAKKSKENGSITLYAKIPPRIKHEKAVKIKGSRIFLSLSYKPGDKNFQICTVITGIEKIIPPIIARFHFKRNIP
jgi:hypothetical protein